MTRKRIVSESRNGYYPKTITASDGEFVVNIPGGREFLNLKLLKSMKMIFLLLKIKYFQCMLKE